MESHKDYPANECKLPPEIQIGLLMSGKKPCVGCNMDCPHKTEMK